jgi:hypothetical protein
MGWLNNVFKKIRGEEPKDRMFVSDLAVNGTAPAWHGQDIAADECYVELFVDSLRIDKQRSFATRFHGLAYSFVSMSREAAPRADYAAVSKPDSLTNLDPDALTSVITVSRQMMGAAPWRGGVLNLELGLFTVKAGDILTPIVDYVGRVSSAAGISFVDSIKPFLPLITEGLDLISGQTADTKVVVGVDTSLSPAKSGFYAMIDRRNGDLDRAKLKVDPIDFRLLYDGQPLSDAYCVFSIRATPQKADYGEIPELRERHAALMTAIGSGKATEARDALTAFRLATVISPDLIPADAALLVKKAENRLKAAFPGGVVSATIAPETAAAETLQSLDLYG